MSMLQDPIHAALKLAACTELAHEGSGGAVAVGAHLLGGAISISGAPCATSWRQSFCTHCTCSGTIRDTASDNSRVLYSGQVSPVGLGQLTGMSTACHI